MRSSVPGTAQSLSEPSRLTLARYRPSGQKAMFQSFTLRSPPSVAINWLSGLKAVVRGAATLAVHRQPRLKKSSSPSCC